MYCIGNIIPTLLKYQAHNSFHRHQQASMLFGAGARVPARSGHKENCMASILIIDDEPPIRTLLRRLLEEDGHQIREAANGHIGLLLYREAPADLVITDLLMPERDGLEVTIDLTQEFLDAKVIAMTGAAGQRSLLGVAKLLGARHVISKPFTSEEIRQVVRVTLEA